MRRATLLAVGLGLATSLAATAQVVPGYTVEDYASVTDPQTRSFMPDGTLFVGRDNSGSGGGTGDPVKIHRVGYGGLPVEEWGAIAINDPDAVLADPLGLFAPAGSVLVAGANPGLGGGIRAILPDQSVIDVFAPDLSIVNPNGLRFDGNGRILMGEDRATFTRIDVSNGGSLSPLIDLPGFGSHTVEPGTNNIYTNVAGNVSIYDENGTLLVPTFTTLPAGAGMAFAPGNSLWGNDLYAMVSSTGELIRIDSVGNTTVIGTGFDASTHGPTFGPDGYMYFSVFSQDKIIRIVPEPSALALLALGGLAALRRRG